MAKAVCSECGCPIEYTKGEDFAYCTMCENDQVEIKKIEPKLMVRRFNTKNREKIKIGNLNIYLPVEKVGE